MVDETRTDMRDQVAWVDRVRAELNGLQEQLPELLQSSEHPSQRKRLQVLSSDLETMVQDLDKLPRLQPAGSPSPTA